MRLLSRTGVIIRNCTKCQNDDVTNIRACEAGNCPLFPYRNGNSGASPFVLDAAIKRKCLQCKADDLKAAEACTDVTCSLFGYSYSLALRPNFTPPP